MAAMNTVTRRSDMDRLTTEQLTALIELFTRMEQSQTRNNVLIALLELETFRKNVRVRIA